MNILVPDSWLREYLDTTATPEQIKEYLSLCGPSVERINKVDKEIVYDIEVTTNRPDSMSVFGIAREAAAILPRFKIKAKLKNDPYSIVIPAKAGIQKKKNWIPDQVRDDRKRLNIKTDARLNPRWTSVVLDDVQVKPSPKWLQNWLELTGIRPLNNIVDITNYLMRTYGQPAHSFDYDQIKPNKKGVPTMILRAAKKGERVTTLDGKAHVLPGGDIVIEDGAGRLIDLCGIMGAENSSIKYVTNTIVLFMQTYDPVQIRKTSMALAHRTEAAQLFEKGLDEELVLPTIFKGIEMVEELAGGKVVSQIYDLYQKPFKPYGVSVQRDKLDKYLGTTLKDKEIENILKLLGLVVTLRHSGKRTKSEVIESYQKDPIAHSVRSRMTQEITVTVPSFRRDIKIDVDIVEEIARIYGYHNIETRLPESAPPLTITDPILKWEEQVKIRLRDWGFTETYTYSMISEELMDLFDLDKKNVYKITNPLSSEWVYMRPSLLPSILSTVKQNLNIRSDFKIFELSNIYKFREGTLPEESPILVVTWIGEKFYEAKGLAESIFELFGITVPTSSFWNKDVVRSDRILNIKDPIASLQDEATKNFPEWDQERSLHLGKYGIVGEINSELLRKLGIKQPITMLQLNFTQLVNDAKSAKTYRPIPKYPPVIEDMSLVLPPQTPIGDVITNIKSISPLINSVELVSQFENTSSFRINYLNPEAPLTVSEVVKLRQTVIQKVETVFQAKIKG